MNSLSVPVHLSVTTSKAQRQQCSLKPLKIEILVRKAGEIFTVHACCTEVLFLGRFGINMIPVRALMDYGRLSWIL